MFFIILVLVTIVFLLFVIKRDTTIYVISTLILVISIGVLAHSTTTFDKFENDYVTKQYTTTQPQTKLLEALPYKEGMYVTQTQTSTGQTVYEFCIKPDNSSDSEVLFVPGAFHIHYSEDIETPYVKYKTKTEEWILSNKPSLWFNLNKWSLYKNNNVGDVLMTKKHITHCEFYLPKE